MSRAAYLASVAMVLLCGCIDDGKEDEIATYVASLREHAETAASAYLGPNRGMLNRDIFIQDQGEVVVVMFLDKAPIEDVPIAGRFGVEYRISKKTNEIIGKRIVE